MWQGCSWPLEVAAEIIVSCGFGRVVHTSLTVAAIMVKRKILICYSERPAGSRERHAKPIGDLAGPQSALQRKGIKSTLPPDPKEGTMPADHVNVVLVHGAWADGSSWSKVIGPLKAAGMTVVAAPLPLTSLADDIA